MAGYYTKGLIRDLPGKLVGHHVPLANKMITAVSNNDA